MTALAAGRPVELPDRPVGRHSALVADPQRDGRLLGVDVWYPAAPSDDPMSVYELLPGVEFEAATAQHDPPVAQGKFPLVLFSHGRTGMRFAYSMLCEALAARGAVVVSSDHPGDALSDWLLGTHVDDRTNEVNRVADAHALLAELLHGSSVLPADVLAAIDHDRVALAGHSYGAYTALATAAGVRGVPPHDRVGAVLCFQPYTRSMSDRALGRVSVPALLVVSELDSTTPAATDADRPWALLGGQPTWRLDLAGAGHQAASDIGLYAELLEHVPALPEPVREYLEHTATDATGPGLRPWRGLLALQVRAAWAFLEVALGLDPAAGRVEAARLDDDTGVRLRQR